MAFPDPGLREDPWADSAWADAVSRFWFGEKGPDDWFGRDPALDAIIRERFGGLHRALAAHPAPPGPLDAERAVAGVIVLDQFPRNMFRGSAEAFATDAAALALARRAVDAGLDQGLNLRQRQFLYLPFMHAEDLATQERSVVLFRALGDAELLDFATEHRDVIARFGRFPGRNAALGRESTEPERDFLAGGTVRW